MYTENLQNMLYYYITIYSIIDKELSLLVLYQKRCDYIYIILYVILCSIILLKYLNVYVIKYDTVFINTFIWEHVCVIYVHNIAHT